MKNHSPEIDFSFSCKRFSVCRKMINRFHTSFFLSNLPIYPKEQPHAISSHAILKRQAGHFLMAIRHVELEFSAEIICQKYIK